MHGEKLQEIFDLLLERFGPQFWWPGEDRYEIIVGAILTQNTNWTNVVKALGNLRKAGLLSPGAIHTLSRVELAEYIRPAGYYNIKARRLKNFHDWLFAEYGGKLELLEGVPAETLREQLLSINGIGRETADSILLYALERPVFVVDAYTFRVFFRHFLIDMDADYEQVRELFESSLAADAKLFNEYHALLVRVGKDFCRPKARCAGCPLEPLEHDEKRETW